MTSKTSAFQHLVTQVEHMSEQQRNVVADGHEDDHFMMTSDDYATDDEFQRAVVAELMKLLAL